MKNNKKGFTLAELLIVVAIIAVLVAISIPIFSSQLEKAREATDAANLRSAYAEAATSLLTDDASTFTKEVDAVQTQDGWQNTTIKDIGGIAVGGSGIAAKTVGDSWTVSISASGDAVEIN